MGDDKSDMLFAYDDCHRSGTFNADGTGNVLNPLVQWQSGQMQLVWPLDQKTADFVFPAPSFNKR